MQDMKSSVDILKAIMTRVERNAVIASSTDMPIPGCQHRRIRNKTLPKGHMNCDLQQRGGHSYLPSTEDNYDLADHLSKLVTLSSGVTGKIRVFEISTDGQNSKVVHLFRNVSRLSSINLVTVSRLPQNGRLYQIFYF